MCCGTATSGRTPPTTWGSGSWSRSASPPKAPRRGGVASPGWEVALEPTDLAPAASASVSGWNTDSGTRLAIEASGLDPAPAGFVYELWFSAEDQHVSAGTFAAVDDVTAWVGVRRGDFPRVWITLEALDGDPGPSRSTVLDTKQ